MVCIAVRFGKAHDFDWSIGVVVVVSTLKNDDNPGHYRTIAAYSLLVFIRTITHPKHSIRGWNNSNDPDVTYKGWLPQPDKALWLSDQQYSHHFLPIIIHTYAFARTWFKQVDTYWWKGKFLLALVNWFSNNFRLITTKQTRYDLSNCRRERERERRQPKTTISGRLGSNNQKLAR